MGLAVDSVSNVLALGTDKIKPTPVNGAQDRSRPGCASQDRGGDLQLTAAVRAVREVDPGCALEQLGPAQPHRAVVRAVRLSLGGLCLLGGRLEVQTRVAWSR